MCIQSPPPIHFWEITNKGGTRINVYMLSQWLIHKGFGLYRMGTKRTSSNEVFHNDDGVLKVHDEY